MNPNQILEETKTKLVHATEHFKEELKKMRTGRAHPGMLDSVSVEAYGQPMPLKALASVTVPEATQLQISPFDPNNLQAISDAIRNDQTLGLSPSDDGHVVRINLPPMTTENREQMVKALHQKVEECMVTARQARHDALRKIQDAEKSKLIGKDERFGFEKKIDELAGKQKDDIDQLSKLKEQEILTV